MGLVIEECIPYGKENAVKRDKLKELTGMNDRDNRKAIAKARERGIPILSSSQYGGYWISEDEAEIEAFCKELISRARELMQIAVALENRESCDVIPVRFHYRKKKRDENQLSIVDIQKAK